MGFESLINVFKALRGVGKGADVAVDAAKGVKQISLTQKALSAGGDLFKATNKINFLGKTEKVETAARAIAKNTEELAVKLSLNRLPDSTIVNYTKGLGYFQDATNLSVKAEPAVLMRGYLEGVQETPELLSKAKEFAAVGRESNLKVLHSIDPKLTPETAAKMSDLEIMKEVFSSLPSGSQTRILEQFESTVLVGSKLKNAENAANLGAKVQGKLADLGKRQGNFLTELKKTIDKSNLDDETRKLIDDALKGSESNKFSVAIGYLKKDKFIAEEITNLTSKAKEIEKGIEESEELLRRLGKDRLINTVNSKTFITTVRDLQYLSTPSLFKAVTTTQGMAGLAALVAAPAFAAIYGTTVSKAIDIKDTAKACKDQIVDLRTDDDSVKGKTWNSTVDDVTASLSALESVDLGKYQHASLSNLNEQQASLLYDGLSDVVQRVETVRTGFEKLSKPDFYSAYTHQGQSTSQAVGEFVDKNNPLSSFTGNVTAANNLKQLGSKGLQEVGSLYQELEPRAMELAARKEPEKIASADKITEDYIKCFAALQEAFNYRDIDSLTVKLGTKKTITKQAGLPLAAIGSTLLTVLTVLDLVTEGVNLVIKSYVRLSSGWNDLSKMIGDIVSTLDEFASAEAKDNDSKAFIDLTKKVSINLKKQAEVVKSNFPVDLQKTFETGVSAEDEQKVKQTLQEMVSSQTKYQAISQALDSINESFNGLLSNEYYQEFDKTIESKTHSVMEVFDEFFTLFSGEGTISDFGRMKYRISRAQAQINVLKKEIEKIHSTTVKK